MRKSLLRFTVAGVTLTVIAACSASKDSSKSAPAPDTIVAHPMNWVEVGGSVDDAVSLAIDGGPTMQLLAVSDAGRVAVNIPFFKVGTGAVGKLLRGSVVIRNVRIAPEPAQAGLPGDGARAFLESLRPLQTGASAAGQIAKIDALEALITKARTAPVEIGTSGGAPVVLDAAALSQLDGMQAALHEPTLELPHGTATASVTSPNAKPLFLFGRLNGIASIVGDATAYVMNGAQTVAGIPKEQQEQPGGWIGTIEGFIANHTPNEDGTPVGKAVVELLGKKNAEALAERLKEWAADHKPEDPAVDPGDGPDQIQQLADGIVEPAPAADAGPDSGDDAGDAGSCTSIPDAGASCNAVADVSTPLAGGIGAKAVGAGGVIEDGTYVLTQRFYDGTPGTGPVSYKHITVKVCANFWQAFGSDNNAPPQRWNYVTSVSGSTIGMTASCTTGGDHLLPQSKYGPVTFTANATSISLFDGGETYVLTKR